MSIWNLLQDVGTDKTYAQREDVASDQLSGVGEVSEVYQHRYFSTSSAAERQSVNIRHTQPSAIRLVE